MNEALWLALAVLAGAAAGLVFFGGLWYTVRRLAAAARPRLFLLQSFLLRTAVVLGLLYLSAGGGLLPLAGYGLGFWGARSLILRRFVA